MNLSVSLPLDSRSPFGTFVPPPPAGGVFPGRGAFGKEMELNRLPRPPLIRGGGTPQA